MMLLDTWRSLRAVAGAVLGRRLVPVFLIGLVSNAFEIVGVGMIFPVLLFMSDPDRMAGRDEIATLRQVTGLDRDSDLVLVMLLAVAAAFIAKTVFRFAYLYVQSVWTIRLGNDVASHVLTRYMAMPYIRFLERDTGDLVRNLTILPYGAFTSSAMMIVNVATDVVLVAGILAVILVVQPVAVVTAIVVIGGLLAVLFPFLRSRNRKLGAAINVLSAERIAAAQQSLGDGKLLRVHGVARYFEMAMRRLLDRYVDVSWRHQVLAGLPTLVVEAVFVLGVVAVFAVLTQSGFDFAEIAAAFGLFVGAALRLLPAATRILNALNTLHRHEAGLATLVRELAEPVEAVAPSDRATAAMPLTRAVTVDHLGYTYAGRVRPAVHDLTFAIQTGTIVGITGPSGAGKTTVLDLVLGLLQPTAGSIRVDGRDIFEDIEAWRRNIGYVPQTVFLLNDTLRRNVAYGQRGSAIDDARVWRALRDARLEADVTCLPLGLETRLGDGGSRLSGGQAQRLGVARALYRDPAVLVLDEITAALDAETEREVWSTIEALRGDKTIIAVSHRAALLRRCDRVIVLRDGRIAADGPFEPSLLDADAASWSVTGTDESPATPPPPRAVDAVLRSLPIPLARDR